MPFEELYQRVSGIVHKARKDYYIKLWEKEDWDQEGMLILHQLLTVQPDIAEDPSRLYRYYKVKFRNYIKDQIRHQESQKRQFDRMHHEDITELSHLVADKGLPTDEKVALKDRLSSYYAQLSPTQQAQYHQLISGQCFKGRRKMIIALQAHLSDFGGE